MSRSWSRSYVRGDGVRTNVAEEQLSSGKSPWGPDRQLILRANTMSHHLSYVGLFNSFGELPRSVGPSCSPDLISHGMFTGSFGNATQQAYGRLRGKLYKGNAALGVTMASYAQSRDMIVKQANVIRSQAEDLSSIASRKKFTKRLADRHLEVIFGWQPLIADIVASATSVIQLADVNEFVKGYGTQSINHTPPYRDDSDVKDYVNYSGVCSVSMGGVVLVTNPNKWLAERAGLLNPLAVAWDLVPFSFLINMVSNTGSLVNRITDFSGLTFKDAYTTRKLNVAKSNVYISKRRDGTYQFGYDTVVYNKDKRRTLGIQGPPVKLSFRMPELSWSTAAMAASLMVQQAVPMIRLGASLKRAWRHRDIYTD